MPASNEDFPWPSHYGHFEFFEDRMTNHHKVSSILNCGNGLYELRLKSNQVIKVFICECYSFGVAEYRETADQLGQIDVIIINSVWCGYTLDAKRHCRDRKVGVFMIRDFMAALNTNNIWDYLNDTETEFFQENGWL